MTLLEQVVFLCVFLVIALAFHMDLEITASNLEHLGRLSNHIKWQISNGRVLVRVGWLTAFVSYLRTYFGFQSSDENTGNCGDCVDWVHYFIDHDDFLFYLFNLYQCLLALKIISTGVIIEAFRDGNGLPFNPFNIPQALVKCLIVMRILPFITYEIMYYYIKWSHIPKASAFTKEFMKMNGCSLQCCSTDFHLSSIIVTIAFIGFLSLLRRQLRNRNN